MTAIAVVALAEPNCCILTGDVWISPEGARPGE